MSVAIASTAIYASPANAEILAPPPDKIVVELVTVNGSGCPRGTAAVAVAPDNTAFTITYSDYLAQVGVGARPIDFRKNCQINVKVYVPQGFTFAIAKVDYRGFASLARGANAIQRANYYFQGNSQTAFTNYRLTGPKSDSWINTDEVPVAALVWRACGDTRLLNINTELRVNVGSSNPKKTTSFVTMDSTDGSINTIYHFAWKTCR